jgi:hypothetical protein
MRAAQIGLIGAAVGVVVYAMFSLTPDAESVSTADELELPEAAGDEQRRERLRTNATTRKFIRPLIGARMRLESAHEARSEQEDYVPPPPTPGEISADEALTAFNLALDAMDEALENGRPSRRHKRELHAQVTNAFTALSTHLDGRDPEQRAVLEQAHQEMKVRMKSLKMTVPKRPSGVLDPADR